MAIFQKGILVGFSRIVGTVVSGAWRRRDITGSRQRNKAYSIIISHIQKFDEHQYASKFFRD